MAEQNTNIQNTNDNQTDPSAVLKQLIQSNPLMKGAFKESEKRGAEAFGQAADTEGIQSANQNLINQILQISGQKTDIPGTEIGVVGALGNLFSGKGFDPGTPKQLQVSPKSALSLLEFQQKQKQAKLQEPIQQAQLIKTLQDIGKGQDIDIFTGKSLLPGKVEEARAIEKAKLEEKLISKRQGESQSIQTNFNTVVGQFKQLVAQAKGAGEEQDGLGLIPGLLGGINTAFKNPKFSRRAALPGQINETSLVFNRVLTGQNRVIKGVVQMIRDTLLSTLDPGTTIAAKTRQSLTNAFRIQLAFKKVGFSPDVLNRMTQTQLDSMDVQGIVNSFNMTPEEQQEIEVIVQDVLNTPAAQAEELPGFETKGKKLGATQQKRLSEIRARRAAIQKELSQ